ncbi:GLPGLI family protein [Niabella drilacis]|uniref:GLPGLI family protein n=1 Tax=Niabella drilacis (strain DSM 25811 / CCM 8410 / CCUG 62505 / LMG 26954 / E90) TaxID=1285928 RepID=A0A1G6SBW0_NIADE|nr:GLPGLI family protein [Niabella drilacis]SDD14213.1 GLPGLI family protein [Niabella drilacis]
MTRNIHLHPCIYILLLIGVHTSATAQITLRTNTAHTVKNPQPVMGSVLYDFNYVKDTSRRDYIYTETFELDYAKTSSYFTSYTAKQNDTLMKNQMAMAFKNAPDPDHVEITLTGSAATSTDKFYTERHPQSRVYAIKMLVGASFIIPDAGTPTNWKIIDSTKTIQGYVCQKATGSSYGRHYTAWFCTDLPYRFGPRRLNGLPGLILEAYDDRMEVVYRLNRVENLTTGRTPIGLPADAEMTTNAAFARAEEAFKRNPQGFIDARSSRATTGRATGITGSFDVSKIKSINVKKTSTEPKGIKANNPIDLVTDSL